MESKETTKPEAKADAPKNLLAEAKDETKVAAGAPEKYTDFTIPEGFSPEAETLTKAQGLFKELNLPQESAQKLVDFYGEAAKQVSERHTTAWNSTIEGWITEIKGDKELGSGDDKVLKPEVRANIGRLLDSYPNRAALDEAMAATGMGNNPEFARFLNFLAKSHAEGKPVVGNPPKPAPKTAGEHIWPNLASRS